MKDILISIPDKEYPFFMKLINSLDFVKVKGNEEKPPTKEHFLKGIEQAVEEVNDIKAGRKKGQTLSNFLNEL